MKTNRIKYVNPSNPSFNGLTGSILSIDNNRMKYTFLIQFDKNVGGHSGEGLGKEGHCYWCKRDVIKPYYCKSRQIVK